MTPGTEKIEVTVRTNSGEDKTIPAADVDDAMAIAKKLRTPDSYMVCVVQDGVRSMRWDRATVVGENRWRKKDPDAFELLGPACEATVTYVSQAEIQAAKAQWLAESWLDNQDYADGLNAQIAAETVRLAPSVRDASIAYYEAYDMNALMDEIQRDLMNPEVYRRYDAWRDDYNRWSITHRSFAIENECGGIEHPSVSIPRTVSDHLKSRGFRPSINGWQDARGVQIPIFLWLEQREKTDDSPRPPYYEWYDPAGLQTIHAKYDAQYNQMVELGLTATKLYNDADYSGRGAYLDGQSLDECPHAKGTLPCVAWIGAWEQAKRWRYDLPHELTESYRSSGIDQITLEMEPFRVRANGRKNGFHN